MNAVNIVGPAPGGYARTVAAGDPAAAEDRREQALREAATSFEATFIAEMLSHAGADAAQESFGGGFAEETFRSLLAREWGAAIADAGGLGLAESIFTALKGRDDV